MHGAIIFARLDSSRFPGKVFKKIQGLSLIEIILQRLFASGFSKQTVCIATTERVVDEDILLWGRKNNIPVYRGQVDDVARRCLNCARFMGWDNFARVNADSPLVLGSLVKQALDTVVSGEADFATNLVPRTYPYGVASEALKTNFYEKTLSGAYTEEFEHVTAHLYRDLPQHTKTFTYSGPVLSDCNFAVDTPEDFDRIRNYLKSYQESATSVNPINLARKIKGV